MVSAIDDVNPADEHRFTDDERARCLAQANLRSVKYISGHLPLYTRMHVLIFGKPCVSLGVMNGLECIVERIVPAAEEAEPDHTWTGEPVRFLK